MKEYKELEIKLVIFNSNDVLTYSSDDAKDNLGDDPFLE